MTCYAAAHYFVFIYWIRAYSELRLRCRCARRYIDMPTGTPPAWLTHAIGHDAGRGYTLMRGMHDSFPPRLSARLSCAVPIMLTTRAFLPPTMAAQRRSSASTTVVDARVSTRRVLRLAALARRVAHGFLPLCFLLMEGSLKIFARLDAGLLISQRARTSPWMMAARNAMTAAARRYCCQEMLHADQLPAVSSA